MNKHQVKGRIKESVGKVKEITGDLVGNKSLEAEGKIQKTAGEIEAAYGDAKNEIENG